MMYNGTDIGYGNDYPFYILHGKECDVISDARKLAVRTEKDKDVKNFVFSVTFQPYYENIRRLLKFIIDKKHIS